MRQIQEQLNVIAGAYPAIPKITADGIYGSKTAESVRKFQEVFQLPQTGKVDYSTWYKISENLCRRIQNRRVDVTLKNSKSDRRNSGISSGEN